MPKFTIETTYDLPIYRHVTYEAATAEDAMAMAMADDDWSGQKEDIESGHDTRITGAWAGEEAYKGDHLPIPSLETEPYGFVYRLRYGPDHWSHQLMFSDAACFKVLPAADVKEVVALYPGTPVKDHITEAALRYGYAAISSLLEQIGQMRGMFTDEDGAIQQAVDDGDAAIEDIGKALARLA